MPFTGNIFKTGIQHHSQDLDRDTAHRSEMPQFPCVWGTWAQGSLLLPLGNHTCHLLARLLTLGPNPANRWLSLGNVLYLELYGRDLRAVFLCSAITQQSTQAVVVSVALPFSLHTVLWCLRGLRATCWPFTRGRTPVQSPLFGS